MARDNAGKRLLNAAKRYGIVPVGFIDGHLHCERLHAEVRARANDVAMLVDFPSLRTDIALAPRARVMPPATSAE